MHSTWSTQADMENQDSGPCCCEATEQTTMMPNVITLNISMGS